MKLKKLAAVLSAAAVAVSSFILPVEAMYGMGDGQLDPATGLMYQSYRNGWYVSCTYDSAKTFNGQVTIPSEWGEGDNKKPVIAMDNKIFENGDNATSVFIPASVVEIDYTNGYDGSSVAEIKVDSNNPNFCSEDGVLYNKNKTEIILYPPKKSGDTFTFPSTVTAISEIAFNGAKNLKSISAIPEGINTISLDTFAYSGIENLSFPASATKIEGPTGIRYLSLKSITVDANNSNYCTENGVLYDKNKTELILYPTAKEDSAYDIPETVTKLGRWSIFNFHLQKVTIPTSVKEMGCTVFWDNESNKVTLYYTGTRAQWNSIAIAKPNYIIEHKGVICSDDKPAGTVADTSTTPQEPSNAESTTVNSSTAPQEPSNTESTTTVNNSTAPQESSSAENENGTTAFTPTVENSKKFSEEQMQDVKAVRADAPSGAFDGDVNMTVEPLSITEDTFSVDIKFVDPDSGQKVQPNKAVTVKIPIPENLKNAENLNLYHVDDNGKITKVDFKTETVEGKQYAVFEAASFSEYKITTIAIPEASDDSSQTSEATEAADSVPENTSAEAAAETTEAEAANDNNSGNSNGVVIVIIVAVLIVLAIGGVVLFKIIKKRK